MTSLLTVLKERLKSMGSGRGVWLLAVVLRWFPRHLRSIFLFLCGLVILGLGWFGIGKRMKANLELLRPGLSRWQSFRLVVRNLWTLTRAWSFLLSGEKVAAEDIQARIEGAEVLLASYNAGEKTIVTALHIAVNELVPAISALGVRVFAPAEAIPEQLYQVMARLRARHGGVEFTRIQRGQTLQVCREKLNEGLIVVFAVDMVRQSGDGGVLCPLGQGEGYFPVGAAKLALEEEAKVWLAFPYYDRKGKARLRLVGPHELIRTGDSKQDIEVNTAAIIAAYEQFIIENVGDWWQLPWAKLKGKE